MVQGEGSEIRLPLKVSTRVRRDVRVKMRAENVYVSACEYLDRTVKRQSHSRDAATMSALPPRVGMH